MQILTLACLHRAKYLENKHGVEIKCDPERYEKAHGEYACSFKVKNMVLGRLLLW